MKNKITQLIFLFISTAVNAQSTKQEVNYLKSENQNLKQQISLLTKYIETIKEESQKSYILLKNDIDALKLQIQNLQSPNKTTPTNIPQQNTESTTQKTEPPKESNQSTYFGQCRATTKKGTRCSRSAKSNGYCWQHGGQ